MATRDIVPDTDPLIRKTSRNVDIFDDKLGKLLDDMRETLHAADGMGLAAVQVGILRRAVIIEYGDFYLELMNPVITAEYGEQIGYEGCLSVANKNCVVKRPKEVDVEYQDRYGAHQSRHLRGLFARCCCHEVDHLLGILYYDKKYEGELPEELKEGY